MKKQLLGILQGRDGDGNGNARGTNPSPDVQPPLFVAPVNMFTRLYREINKATTLLTAWKALRSQELDSPVAPSIDEDNQRILEALAYMATHCPERHLRTFLPVFYLADKLHMERYGRFIFNESYIAADTGPIAVRARKLIKDLHTKRYKPGTIAPAIIIDSPTVKARREPNEDYFSESDLECIDEILALSKSRNLETLSQDHAWAATDPDDIIARISILNTLPNSDVLIELNSNRHP